MDGQPHLLLAAAGCGVFYLLFDAARYLHAHVSPVRLKQWSGLDPAFEGGGRWFQYDKHHFSVISGALLQVSLIAAVGLTTAGLWSSGPLAASGVAVLSWSLLAVAWKGVLAALPEPAMERALHILIPISHIFYFTFWPVLFPFRVLLRTLDIRDELVEDEEATDEEVQAYIDVGEEEGIFEEGEGRLVQSIVDFGDAIVREVMTPRVDIVGFDADGPIRDLAMVVNRSKHSRVPVYRGTIDDILGVVHIKDLFDCMLQERETSVEELVRPAYFISETKKVAELLREFQIEHLQMAIVVDEFGGTAGLATLEDLLEEIVGEIADEHEGVDEILSVQIDDNVFLVSGLLNVSDLDDLLGTDLDRDEDDFDTVAGLVIKELGMIPRVGQRVEIHGVRFEVERADTKRIYRVRVERGLEKSDPDSGGEVE